jgi:DNA-binding response OmpR family regulator
MVNQTALIIEDEDDLATLFAEALRHAGFETRIVSDGREAQESLVSVVPWLVVLDLHLPNVSGSDILHFIRSDPRLAGTRVIIASADDRSVQLLEDVADLALVKPITFSQLRDLAARFHPGQPEHVPTA